MANITIYTKCPHCGGIGVRSIYGDALSNPPVVELPCSSCGSTGYLELSSLDATLLEDIQNKVSDVLDKCNDILEAMA